MLELTSSGLGVAQLGAAGDTYNTAVYLRRLLYGREIDIAYVTALGGDPFSVEIIQRLAAAGIATDSIERRADRLPGLYSISTDEAGERSFLYWRNQSSARTLFEEPAEVPLQSLGQYQMLFLSAISLAILPIETRDRVLTYLKSFREAGGLVVFDSNYRPTLWDSPNTARNTINRAWQLCDIGLPSVDDEMALYGDRSAEEVRDRLRGWGVASGALKCGESGPISLTDSAADIAFPPAPVVRDTTAAGDSFNAGYLAAILSGRGTDEAMATGHALASFVVGKPGAVVDLDGYDTRF